MANVPADAVQLMCVHPNEAPCPRWESCRFAARCAHAPGGGRTPQLMYICSPDAIHVYCVSHTDIRSAINETIENPSKARADTLAAAGP